RTMRKARALANELNAEAAFIDINVDLTNTLKKIKPDIVIHTSGPFQSQGYEVAEACIDCGAHYIDLADGREFVAGIHTLDEKAKRAGILVVSGASSVQSEEHTSELQSRENLVCRLLLEKKKKKKYEGYV